MEFWYGDGSKPWYLVNPKIAGKWMFIPLKMYLYRYWPIPKWQCTLFFISLGFNDVGWSLFVRLLTSQNVVDWLSNRGFPFTGLFRVMNWPSMEIRMIPTLDRIWAWFMSNIRRIKHYFPCPSILRIPGEKEGFAEWWVGHTWNMFMRNPHDGIVERIYMPDLSLVVKLSSQNLLTPWTYWKNCMICKVLLLSGKNDGSNILGQQYNPWSRMVGKIGNVA